MSCKLHIRCKRVGDFNLSMYGRPQIPTIKQSISKEKGIPVDKQILTYDGLLLEDSHFLDDYGIEDGASLFLSLPLGFSTNIKVSIKLPTGSVVKLLANENDNFNSLKRQLGCLCQLSAQSYEFVLDGALLKGNQTLASCGLKDGSILNIMQYALADLYDRSDTYKIDVRTLTGETISVNVSPSYTIGYLKQLLEGRERVPVDQQLLVFAGKTLEDGRTFSEYNIQNGSTIYAVQRLRGG